MKWTGANSLNVGSSTTCCKCIWAEINCLQKRVSTLAVESVQGSTGTVQYVCHISQTAPLYTRWNRISKYSWGPSFSSFKSTAWQFKNLEKSQMQLVTQAGFLQDNNCELQLSQRVISPNMWQIEKPAASCTCCLIIPTQMSWHMLHDWICTVDVLHIHFL